VDARVSEGDVGDDDCPESGIKESLLDVPELHIALGDMAVLLQMLSCYCDVISNHDPGFGCSNGTWDDEVAKDANWDCDDGADGIHPS
jgi:hypothetical protein